jgi:hypothetical protein
MGTEGQEMNAFTMLRYIDRHLQKNSDDNWTLIKWMLKAIS